jgi:Undecaprenyl-phosphate galactose phosphotransferase WbaP
MFFSKPQIIPLLERCGLSPRLVLLCIADLVALICPVVLIYLLRAAFGGLDPFLYRVALPVLLLGLPLGAGLGLYQGIPLSPPQEMRAFFMLSTILYSGILFLFFLTQTGVAYSRFIFLGGWVSTIVVPPLLRSFCRRRFAPRRWWGRPLIFFNRDGSGRALWRHLRKHPETGLRPAAMFELPDDATRLRKLLSAAAARWPGAAVLLPHLSQNSATVDYMTEAGRYFSDILVVPAFGGGGVHWLTTCDFGMVTALWRRENLLDARRLRMKRCLDLVLCTAAMTVVLPLTLLLAAAIRLDSGGSVFYRQKRVGKNGKPLYVYKFRTMAMNADALLDDCLARDARLCEEWERNHKLKNDPRVTRVGAFLRKTSLDELPQVYNVLAGDMSLVGPRPIVEEETDRYGEVYVLYCRVKPGITGLWQVSGRNDTTYGERVAFDEYYINNWSVWMDLWILSRTVPVVLSGYGAY